MHTSTRNYRVAIALVLFVVTVACYWPITRFGFVNYDDGAYLTENSRVKAGLSGAGVLWAFTTGYFCSWHPLTWLSHMLDCQVWGLNAGGHHFTSLLLHATNSLLLFLLLHRLTGAMWRSALVAALFAWHPLHVESVAWASERKDVLSTLFFLLAIGTYCRYVRAKPAGKERDGHPGDFGPEICRRSPALDYSKALAFFAMGLMSKPMVVTLPFVLLLLDYWPLRRVDFQSLTNQNSTIRRLMLEKIPFFALAFVASVVTFKVQQAGGAVASLGGIPLMSRLCNAAVAYPRYIWNTLWPYELSVIYPYQWHWPLGFVIAAVMLVTVLSIVFVWAHKNYGFLLTGWFWFLGTLVPTIGLVQVGAQSIADRYMYIPSIGLFILLVWGLHSLSSRFSAEKFLMIWMGTPALAACIVFTCIQVSYWQNDEKLFRHALDVTGENYVAYDHLGDACAASGRNAEALSYYNASLKLRPRYAGAHYNLGTLLMRSGQLDEAVLHFRAALTNDPGMARAHNNLGKTLLLQGVPGEALAELRAAVEWAPDWPESHYNLGTTLLKTGNPGEAETEFKRALCLEPNKSEAQMNLGIALAMQGRRAEAIPCFAQAARLDPANPDTLFNFGLALLEENRVEEAAAQFGAALKCGGDNAKTHYRLGVALVRTGQPREAVPHLQQALRLAPDFPDARKELEQLLAEHPDFAQGSAEPPSA